MHPNTGEDSIHIVVNNYLDIFKQGKISQYRGRIILTIYRSHIFIYTIFDQGEETYEHSFLRNFMYIICYFVISDNTYKYITF